MDGGSDYTRVHLAYIYLKYIWMEGRATLGANFYMTVFYVDL